MLNQTQIEVLSDLFENDPDFKNIVIERVSTRAAEAQKRADALGAPSVTNEPAKPKAKRGRPVWSVNKNKPAKNTDNTGTHKDAIISVLKKAGSNGLTVAEVQEKLMASGRTIPGGALNTYLYGLKKGAQIRGEGTRGKTRYVLVA